MTSSLFQLKDRYHFICRHLICLIHVAISISFVCENRTIFNQDFSIARRILVESLYGTSMQVQV